MKNTKKLFSALILGIFLAGLILPFTAEAAKQGPQQCCKLRKAIELDGVTCGTVATGEVVGPLDGSCDLVTPNKCAAANCCLSEKWGMYCLIGTINSVVDWIFVAMITGAVLLVLMGAVSLMTAAGDPTKVTEGRNYILYAAIGLLVAFIARAVPSLVKAILGY